MQRVTGIGGIFFKARDPKALAAWYREHLGIPVEEWGGAAFRWAGESNPGGVGTTIWNPFNADTDPLVPRSETFLGSASPVQHLVVQWPWLLHDYSYAVNTPLHASDPSGLFSLIDFIKCLYYGSKLGEFKQQCINECPPDNQGYINWVQQYGGAGFDDAVRACQCQKAGPEICKKFVQSCAAAPYMGKPPTIRWPVPR